MIWMKCAARSYLALLLQPSEYRNQPQPRAESLCQTCQFWIKWFFYFSIGIEIMQLFHLQGNSWLPREAGRHHKQVLMSLPHQRHYKWAFASMRGHNCFLQTNKLQVISNTVCCYYCPSFVQWNSNVRHLAERGFSLQRKHGNMLELDAVFFSSFWSKILASSAATDVFPHLSTLWWHSKCLWHQIFAMSILSLWPKPKRHKARPFLWNCQRLFFFSHPVKL